MQFLWVPYLVSNDDDYLKGNCKPKNDTGNLCDLSTGPGQILCYKTNNRMSIFMVILF